MAENQNPSKIGHRQCKHERYFTTR